MHQLTINPKFRDVARPLHDDEFRQLEENILKDGRVIQPIITWNGAIVDGHNRWTILQKHPEIPYTVEEMEFADDYEVMAWICTNQLGRRNLTVEDVAFLRGKRYNSEQQRQGGTGANRYTVQTGQNVHSVKSKRVIKDGTAGRIGREYNVDARTIRRDGDFAEGVEKAEEESPGLKDVILSGKTGVPKSVVAEIPKMEPEQRKEVIQKIKSGLPWKRETKTVPVPENLNEIIEDVVASMYDHGEPAEDRTENRVEDLMEILNATVSSFERNVRHSLQHYSTVLSDEAAKEKVITALSEAETVIQKLKGIIL